MPGLFPLDGGENRVIGVSASASRSGYSVLMTDLVPSLHAADMVGSQFFPLFVYDVAPAETDDPDGGEPEQAAMFVRDSVPATHAAPTTTTPIRRDGITDAGLAHFQAAYPGENITKEDVFYYVYGILHSPDYRERYADNLGKELPRIPRVSSYADFRALRDAGRQLGDLHVGYETVPEYPARVEGPAHPTAAQLRVEGMKFGKGKDRTVIHYNPFFTVRDVPLEAYEYVVNGKSAIEWVMERQAVTTDKASGIVKDANAWAVETMGNPRYPLELLLRVVTVSLETMRIVKGLPALQVGDGPSAADTERPAPPIPDLAPGAQVPPPGGQGGGGALVLPFARPGAPKQGPAAARSVPVYDLRVAAGPWGAGVEPRPVGFATVDTTAGPRASLFVARVQGRSMEPTIPDGSWCLFRRVPVGSEPMMASFEGRRVLVQLRHAADPETGGALTLKRWEVARRDAEGNVEAVHLCWESDPHRSLPIDAGTEGIRVVGEFLRTVPDADVLLGGPGIEGAGAADGGAPEQDG